MEDTCQKEVEMNKPLENDRFYTYDRTEKPKLPYSKWGMSKGWGRQWNITCGGVVVEQIDSLGECRKKLEELREIENKRKDTHEETTASL